MDLESICETYFEGRTKPKHLRRFNETTPKGNVIKGWINHKPNRYLGSLLITNVNDEETNQFIQSMPKIHYINNDKDISKYAICREKLDGTCLILYPLKNKDGEIIEIVPKTRGRAIADNHFIELYNKVDKKPIIEFYKENDNILIFELYGVLNQHEIINYDTGIDMRLIGIYDKYGKFINSPQIANEYYFKLPDTLFTLTYKDNEEGWILENRSYKYSAYLPFLETTSYPTVIDAVDGIQHKIEELNKEYIQYNGIRATEGVVIYTNTVDGRQKWIKCKPKDIEIEHRGVHGVPRSSITKEVLKYFDEYGSEVQEIYLNDKNHHIEYLHRMLSEEFPVEMINKSRKRIENVFMQIWDAKQVPKSIHDMCEELINDNPDKDIPDLMRAFALKYPMKKKQSRLIYSVLEHKLK